MASSIGSSMGRGIPSLPIGQRLSRCRRTAHATHHQTRQLSIQGRTYDDALELLDTLKSNAATTKLFNAPSGGISGPAAPSMASLNARAIPEMREWLARAGYSASDLAQQLRCVHVAGTKGKGSTCAYTAAILRKAFSSGTELGDGGRKRRVGMYTSPHLISVRERIEIDGAPVGRETFAQRFFEVWETLDAVAAREGAASDGATRPFYFRFLTILALHTFLREGVRDAVVECGIGGEYDATNVLPAEAVSAAVVTHLGVDHVAMLGSSVEEIAWHKAGIFKRGVAAFTRTQGPAVAAVLRRRAEEKGARLVELTDGDVERGPWVEGGGGVAGMEGVYQRDNRALAVAAAMQHLKGGEFDLDAARGETWLPDALAGARLRGRGQVLVKNGARWHLDGAHTEDSVRLAGEWFAGKPRRGGVKRVLVFNQQDRDAGVLLEALMGGAGGVDGFDAVVFTRNEVAVAAGAEMRDLRVQRGLEERMRRLVPGGAGMEIAVVGSLEEALGEVRRVAGGWDVDVLVTGSLYLVGGVLEALGEGRP